ncbi:MULTISPECIES: hypothetical protein [unclassified Flavobacterium]|jgi:hypothetical protein|uniref:hypothetical protein n=1 Tax=unclassified Flavobacterium TaxID=196869 RepID=UPI0012A9D8CF|nr:MULTISPECIES: hypothetical protein [unclassified Flavobacterium]MBF4487319.1 hypothetical protein [Flavobacterium sp. CSZ]QGK72710.1 hypothetical protein GIY83_01080 [Flavobacterium sp. SLB02]
MFEFLPDITGKVTLISKQIIALIILPSKKNNSSILGGVGVDLWKLNLDYRYLAGVTDLDPSGRNVKTVVFNISLGFKSL